MNDIEGFQVVESVNEIDATIYLRHLASGKEATIRRPTLSEARREVRGMVLYMTDPNAWLEWISK